MTRFAPVASTTLVVGSLAFAGSAVAASAPPASEVNIDFTVQLDDNALAALQAAGIPEPTFQGYARYDRSNLTGSGFEFLSTSNGFNGFTFRITDRKDGAAADLPDISFELIDSTGGNPEAVFFDGDIQGFNFESVPNAPTFGPRDVAFGQGLVRVGSDIVPGEGYGELVFDETDETDEGENPDEGTGDDAAAIPTPTAFAAGLLGIVLATRRRRHA